MVNAPAAQAAPGLSATAGTPGTTADNGDGTSTYTHWDGETVTFEHEIELGESIELSGTGWLAKPDMVDEGEEGSVIGFKLIDAQLGMLDRTFALTNPRLGEPVTNTTVWDTVWAAGSYEEAVNGSWDISLAWPDASNAVTAPNWEVGDTFSIQLLSGTMYSDEASVDPNTRPDVSRTTALEVEIVGEEEDPTDPTDPDPTDPDPTDPDPTDPDPTDPDPTDPDPTDPDPTDPTDPEPEESAPVFVENLASDDVRINLGDSGKLTVKTQSFPKPTFTWQRSTTADFANPETVTQRVSPGQYDATTGEVTSALTIPGDQVGAAYYRVIAGNEVGAAAVSNIVTVYVVAVAPRITTDLPDALTVRVGTDTELSIDGTGVPTPEVVWERSDDRGTTWTTLDGAGVTTETDLGFSNSFTIENPSLQDNGALFRAKITNAAAEVISKELELSVTEDAVPLQILTQPQSQEIEAGETVTFEAAAGETDAQVKWQRSTDGGVSWNDLRGATNKSYSIASVTESLSGALYRAEFTSVISGEQATTEAATLTVTPRNNIRTYCGTSYGPGSVNTGVPFCFEGPEKVVYGEDIVINGLNGYLATDGQTGSVINFFLDAQYSGDPNTITSKQNFTNPATGAPLGDNRTHAITQADSNGTWTATIKWPTPDNVNLTQAQIDERFAPGTNHSIRMLTGSLLPSPTDLQRGGSVFFTVVESLDDEVEITEPLYSHFTLNSTAAGDDAVAWVPSSVGSGNPFELTGTGWLTRDKQWGSTVTVRLLQADGSYYESPNPIDVSDPSVWQIVQASEDGVLNTEVALPAGIKGGDFLAVELSTSDDGTELGDVDRLLTSLNFTIDQQAYVPPIGEDAQCTANPSEASYELAPGMNVPAANVGGTIRMTGENWCNLVGGGSLIAIKINAGSYSHLNSETAHQWNANIDENSGSVIGNTGESPTTLAKTNKTIWYIIEADSNGSFDVNIPLPNRENSNPKFSEGSYTFQLLTRAVSADEYYQGARPDPSRTVETNEFTVVTEGQSLDNVKPGKPTAAPEPLHATNNLTNATQGGVKITQSANHWTVDVPNAKPGDWVFVYMYQDLSPRLPWGVEWFEVNRNRQITLPLDGATLIVGTNKLSVQDRTGALLGWNWATVAADTPPTASNNSGGNSGSGGNTTTNSGSGNSGTNSASGGSNSPFATGPSVRPPMNLTAPQVAMPKPEGTPAHPVPGYEDLSPLNRGDVTAVEQDGALTVTLPSIQPGEWVFLFLYLESGEILPIDWVQVGGDHTITIEIGTLPNGKHRLAFVDAYGQMVGWVPANGPDIDVVPDEFLDPAPEQAGFSPTSENDITWTLILIGAAILILAGSFTGFSFLSPTSPKRTSTNKETLI